MAGKARPPLRGNCLRLPARSRMLSAVSCRALLDGEGYVKKKTAKVDRFIEDLHEFIKNHPQFRRQTGEKSEVRIQAEIRPIIIRYLEDYFDRAG